MPVAIINTCFIKYEAVSPPLYLYAIATTELYTTSIDKRDNNRTIVQITLSPFMYLNKFNFYFNCFTIDLNSFPLVL